MISTDPHAPRHRGFALLEMLIALVILTVLVGVGIQARIEARNRDERARVVLDYTEEMRQLARAAQEHVAAQTWADGAVNTVTVAALIAANRLPSGFGTRSLGAGRSPLGAAYEVRARRNAGAPPTIVVYEGGTTSVAYAQALGFQNATAQPVFALRREAASRLREDRFASATIAAGTRTARGAGSAAWTKDLTDMLAANLQTDAVAVLLGYLDLGGTIGNDPLPPGSFAGDCRIIPAQSMCTQFGGNANCTSPGATWAESSCSASFGPGWNRVDTVSVCPVAGQVSFRSTPAGTLSYSTTETITPGSGVCNPSCSGSHPCEPAAGATNWETVTRFQDIRLNDVPLITPLCETIRDFNSQRDASGTVFCGYAQGTEPWGNTNVLAANPRHVLCCRSN